MSEITLPQQFSIVSSGNPAPDELLAARHRVNADEALAETFKVARKEGWSADRLSTVLELSLPKDTARYLADEFNQVGDAIVIASARTGRCIGRLTDADLWQPPPYTREDGSVVQATPRIRPELEAALVMHFAEAEREEGILTHALARMPQSALQREEGDMRLLWLTANGRAAILSAWRALPRDWWVQQAGGAHQGVVQAVRWEDNLSSEALLFTLEGQYKVSLCDLAGGVNMRFDQVGNAQRGLGRALLRDLVRKIAARLQAEQSPARPPREGEVVWAPSGENGICFAPGALRVAVVSDCMVRGVDISDRWEIRSQVQVRVSFDPERVACLPAPTNVFAAELVR